MKNKSSFYILWGKYYNPVLDTYTEKMLGCYKKENNANKMANTLQKMRPECEYFVSTAFFYDQEE